MIVFPPVKLNVGLHVGQKQQDGFHDIESYFIPVNWCDALEMIPVNHFSFHEYGRTSGAEPWQNLVVRAYDIMRREFSIPELSIHLLKDIPAGAGLGGGSSDAAAFLKAVNQLFSLGLPMEELFRLAAPLGSDCFFFLQNHEMKVSGRGEVLEYFSLNDFVFDILVVFPGIHIPTAWAYRQLDEWRSKEARIDESRLLPDISDVKVESWKSYFNNDFEQVVFRAYPQLEQIKKSLYESGAIYASLSGSGSALFGIYERKLDLDWVKPYVYRWCTKPNGAFL